MRPSDEQYERVARYLDGESVSLSDAGRALADEIRRDETRLGGMLDVAVPPETLARAERRAVLAAIRRDEAVLAARLDVTVPPGTMQRVQRRMVAALARPRRRRLRIGPMAAAVAAAAAIVLAVIFWPRTPSVVRPRPVASSPPKAIPVEVIVASVEEPEDLALDLLAEEIDRLEAEILVAPPPTLIEVRMDLLQNALEEFWLDDFPEDPVAG